MTPVGGGVIDFASFFLKYMPKDTENIRGIITMFMAFEMCGNVVMQIVPFCRASLVGLEKVF